ncbi:MAG: helix-turn-helix domain-containing protein [Rhodocyclaceae bacterium]
MLPSGDALNEPFSAAIDRYAVGDLLFTDCRSGPLLLDRSLARISTDNIRDYVFHVFIEGGVHSVVGAAAQPRKARPVASLLALDMNQPVRMQRSACRVLTFFAPRALVESVFPDADSIHGRVIESASPLTRLIIDQAVALNRGLSAMSASEAGDALRSCIHLLLAAFGKQSRLSGNARAAVRAAVFGQVRRHIQNNLHQSDLSPETLLNTLSLSRPALYRLFAHEGGLAAYIRRHRLRAAADELVRFPHLAVMDIAYGLGFKSPAHFTRAFRRAHEMTPQDFRALVAMRRANGETSLLAASCDLAAS